MSYPPFWSDSPTRGRWKARALAPLGWLVCAIAWRRHRRACDGEGVTRLPVPVVVVGNITVGGTGKTPLLIHLVERLREAGWHPGVVSRGYGGKPGKAPLLVDAETSPVRCGDEPKLIALRTGVPVAVHPDRVAAAEALLAAFPDRDVILSDDGLQHHALGRDVEIAVIDRTRGFGNRRCLPAGPLREPLARLEKVDLLVINTPVATPAAPWSEGDRAVLDALATPCETMQLQPRHLRRLRDGACFHAGNFPHHKVHAVAGIGNPARFFETLRRLGLTVMAHPLADHAAPSASVLDIARDPEAVVVMTEKDAVKWPFDKSSGLLERHFVLQVDAHLPDSALQIILNKLDRQGRSDEE